MLSGDGELLTRNKNISMKGAGKDMRAKHGRLTMECLFLLLYIPLVIGMMLVMPIGAPPDEPAHLSQEWLLGTGQIRTETPVFPENLKEILKTPVVSTDDAKALNAKTRGTRLSAETAEGRRTEATGIYPLAAYVPQALGMRIARLFTDRIDLICYGARIGSMIATGLLFWLAIRRSPKGKMILLAVACLPLTLQEAASASCDGVTAAGICWITVELLRRVCGEKEKNVPSALRSAAFGAGAVLCKLFYSPVLLLGLMTGAEPEGKKQRRRNNLIMFGVFAACLALWYMLSVKNLSGREGLTSGALDRAGEVAANPLILLGAQVRTIVRRAPGWIRQLFGVYGRLDVFSPWILTVLTGVSFLGVALADGGIGLLPGDAKRAGRFRLMMLLILVICWMLLSFALLVWWTAGDSPLIEGIQGRYFVPMLFGLLLCRPDILKGKANREIWRNGVLAAFIACSAATVILLAIRL